MVTICYQKVLTINQLKFCAKGMNQITLLEGIHVQSDMIFLAWSDPD